jgi:hypothetical protein
LSLTDDEKAHWRERFLSEVAQEHERRTAAAAEQKSTTEHKKAERTRSGREELEREAEIARLRLKVREEFWQERGYVAYTDSRGTRLWLTPDEYEERMARRKRRRKPTFAKNPWEAVPKRAVFVAIVLGLAVLVGLFVGGM